MKKSVSSGLATHRMEQQSRVLASLPLAVNRSPTCSTCRHMPQALCHPPLSSRPRHATPGAFNSFINMRTSTQRSDPHSADAHSHPSVQHADEACLHFPACLVESPAACDRIEIAGCRKQSRR